MLDGEDAAPNTLSPRTLLLIEDVRLEWRELDRRIAALTPSLSLGLAVTRRPDA